MSTPRAQSHPGVAAVLSFIFSGVGQIYNGEIRKGLVHIAVTTTGLVLVLVGALAFGVCLYAKCLSLKIAVASVAFMFIGGVIICVIGVHSIYDAYKNACVKE